jgi:hypothetical protein
LYIKYRATFSGVIGGVFFDTRCDVGGSYQANFADNKKTTVRRQRSKVSITPAPPISHKNAPKNATSLSLGVLIRKEAGVVEGFWLSATRKCR